MNSFLRFASLGLSALLLIVVIGCDSGGSSDATADCDSRTGNVMAATVNGTAICTDLGTALLLSTTSPRLSVVGLFGAASSSISLNVDNPSVGTFDLAQADAEHDALYGTEDETGYIADRDEGSGSITITELSDTRVKGTFAFTGVGYDINGAPAGEARITKGMFDFALGSTFDF